MKQAIETDPDETGGAPPRRRALFAAVAAGAVLVGAGLAWRRHALRDGVDDAVQALWRLDFDTPSGGKLQMSALRGRPLLLNFWATWCPPCVEELPMLDAFYRERSPAGWQVLGLAVDQVAPVTSFLSRYPVGFPVAMAGTAGVALSKSLGNLSGGLPFSVVLGREGTVLHRKIGKITPDDLRAWGSLG
ncbi:TlpA family protein disulfide reductase [Rhodoferax sp.]|uniref:TlpA family protein disulfide reductase n=1 Tax=Rhodoferax sp. TaxID=50421 RepID=UPI002756AC5F|nr:TlpA disulfide reductase family protein [Rhodoferax sp.]